MMTITPEQCRGARALAAIQVRHLAAKARIAASTLMRFEKRKEGPSLKTSTVEKLETALTEAGVEFAPGGWMRLVKDAEKDEADG